MQILRLLVAGLIAVAAVVGVFLAAVVVFVTGLAAFVLQLFGVGRKGAPSVQAQSGTPPRRPARMPMDDAIDVVSTRLPDEGAKR